LKIAGQVACFTISSRYQGPPTKLQHIPGWRPQASDTEPASRIANATDAVTEEMARLLEAAPM